MTDGGDGSSTRPENGDGGRWSLVLSAAYALLALFIWMGFALHRGSESVIGPYTPGYLAFLLGSAMALALPLAVLLLLRQVLGDRRCLRVVGMVGAGLILCYGVAEVVHAATREHRFDPFLQFPGTRFDSVAAPPTPGVVRVATLGGSTTHNPHLPAHQRYPAVLEELLSSTGPHEVLNAGMDWWTTKHSHINYATYVRDLDPEVVVVMHAINDLYRSFSSPRFSVGAYDPQWSHFYGPAIRGARPHTLIGRLTSSWNAWELNRRWYSKWRFVERDHELATFRSLPDFERNLRSLVRTLRADGVRILLLTQPSLYHEGLDMTERARLWFPVTFCATPVDGWRWEVPSVTSMALAMQAYNDAVIRVAAEEGAEVLDLASVVPRTLEYFGDDVHYSAAGAALIAREVARALQSTVPSAPVSDVAVPSPPQSHTAVH
jgi:hypothetical protein